MFPRLLTPEPRNIMKKYTKIALFSLIAASIIAVPALMHAQDASTNAPSSDATPAKPMKHKHSIPFRGTLDGVDTNAMTLTVGDRTFTVTSKTKISKDGQPAVLADGVIGQPVSGSYRPDADDTNTLDAVSVHFGAHKKKASSDDSTMATNAPAASSN